MPERGDRMTVELELLRRCAQGDLAAAREMVERLEKPLLHFLLRFVGDRQVAEDLFQETFVRVMRALRDFRPEASPTTWIFTVARNLALDHLKARRRHREVALETAAADEGGRVIRFRDVLHAAGPDPAMRAETAEEERRAAEALADLPAPQREALTLRLYAGLPYAEIARVVGAPVGTVKFRVHEAVWAVARKLGAEGPAASAQGG